jgi:hypothetical protein
VEIDQEEAFEAASDRGILRLDLPRGREGFRLSELDAGASRERSKDPLDRIRRARREPN